MRISNLTDYLKSIQQGSKQAAGRRGRWKITADHVPFLLLAAARGWVSLATAEFLEEGP